MSDADSGPEATVVGEGFAGGLPAQFEAFCRGKPDARRLVVRLTLANNEILEFEGLRVDHLRDVPGSVMIQGTSAASRMAVVVRDVDIFKAEFEADPVSEEKFGF